MYKSSVHVPPKTTKGANWVPTHQKPHASSGGLFRKRPSEIWRDCSQQLVPALNGSTGRFATASFKSMARRRLRSHAQDRSTRLQSGDFCRTLHNFTLAALCASLHALVRRNVSLSQRTVHGPPALTGFAALIGFTKSCLRTIWASGPIFADVGWDVSMEMRP